MTEAEELMFRRDALKETLETARQQVAAREAERTSVLRELEARRGELRGEVAALEAEVGALEAVMESVNEAWKTATREAAGARAHLAGLS